MIVNTEAFLRKYLENAIIPLVLSSAILTSSLIRNAVDISLWETIAGLGAIAVSIAWSAMRDALGYWIYSMSTMRFQPPTDKAYSPRLQSPWRQFFACHPFGASLLSLLAVGALCSLTWPISESWRYWLIGLLGVLALPLWLYNQLRKSLPYMLHQVSLIVVARQEGAAPLTQRPWYGVMFSDLILSLMVNFTLVLPIARKDSFSLALGYTGPVFFVAFAILMTIVMIFMLAFVAAKSRRYVYLGEILAGRIAPCETPKRLLFSTSKGALLLRCAVWLLAIALWSPAVCILFSLLNEPPSFIAIYLFALVPVMAIYLVERRQALAKDLNEANEMWHRYNAIKTSIEKNVS